jgi:Flp pilus assembly protein TadB
MTDYATMTVYLFEEDVENTDEKQDDDDGIDWRFVESIKYAGWLAVQTVNFVIIALGVIVPSFILIAIVALVAYRLVLRRRKDS